MSIKNPAELVAEFKKSGEFDRLRRDLLHQFRNRDDINAFMTRANEIVQAKLSSYSNVKLYTMGPDALYAELASEMDRYPLVQRAVANMPVFSDPSFQGNIRHSVSQILVATRQPNGQIPSQSSTTATRNLAQGEEASKLDANQSPHRDRSQTPDPKPIISLNGRNIYEERIETNAQPNGAPAGNHRLATSLSDEERQGVASDDEQLPTRRYDVGHGVPRSQPNGDISNGLRANPNRRESAMDIDN